MYTNIQIVKFNIGGQDGMSCFPADWSLDRILSNLAYSAEDLAWGHVARLNY